MILQRTIWSVCACFIQFVAVWKCVLRRGLHGVVLCRPISMMQNTFLKYFFPLVFPVSRGASQPYPFQELSWPPGRGVVSVPCTGDHVRVCVYAFAFQYTLRLSIFARVDCAKKLRRCLMRVARKQRRVQLQTERAGSCASWPSLF